MEKTPSRSWINRADRWLRKKLIFLFLEVELCLGIAVLLVVCLLSEVLPDARLAAPEPSLLVLDRQGRFLDEMESAKGKELGYWPLAALPSRVVAATMAAEDRRFFSHPGVDPLAVVRAAFRNRQSGRRISGASTLAMQVARMQEPGPRTLEKKVREALTALALVRRYGREAVLAHYLRIAPYGNRIHGIAYAARRYFGKPVEDMSWAEIALLSAIPQAPGRMNPCSPHGLRDAVRRGRSILRILRQQNALTKDEYELSLYQIDRMELRPLTRRPVQAIHAILRLEAQWKDPRTRRELRNHPVVTASIDLDLQRKAVRMVGDALRSWEDKAAGNAAMVVVDRDTREVLAWVGSSGYFDGRRFGAIDFARIARPAGSTLKPFFYAYALDQGVITPATVLDDLRRGPGSIENADAAFLGPLLPREALANSRNVPAVHLLTRIGIENGYAFLGRLGLHWYEHPSGRYGRRACRRDTPRHPGAPGPGLFDAGRRRGGGRPGVVSSEWKNTPGARSPSRRCHGRSKGRSNASSLPGWIRLGIPKGCHVRPKRRSNGSSPLGREPDAAH